MIEGGVSKRNRRKNLLTKNVKKAHTYGFIIINYYNHMDIISNIIRKYYVYHLVEPRALHTFHIVPLFSNDL